MSDPAMVSVARRASALLLIGPTGAGKTPLGDFLEAHGLGERRCCHLDFGTALRALATGRCLPGLREADRATIRDALQTGALLENETFYIAEAILRHALESNAVGEDDLLILNGLPRHVEQARDVDRILDLEGIVYLACDPAVVRRRIRNNTGGDRTGREDDDAEFVQRKLELFAARTRPLLDHYREKGVRIHTVQIQYDTTPATIVDRVLQGRSATSIRRATVKKTTVERES